MKKAQIIHKCGDDESEGLFHVIRMCCLGWDSQSDLSCMSNGEGSKDALGTLKLQMLQLMAGCSLLLGNLLVSGNQWVSSWKRNHRSVFMPFKS